MGERNSKNKPEFIGRLIYSIFFAIAVVFLVAVIVSHHSDSIYGGESLDYSSTWSYESGTPVDFNHITIDGESMAFSLSLNTSIGSDQLTASTLLII